MAVQTQIQVRRGTAATWTSTNPTLAAGELGFETDTGKFKIGNGSSTWTALSYAGGGQNTLTTYQYTATAGQTTFSGTDANGNTLAYTAGAVQVYLNGALLVNTTDYAATNGTSVVLTTGATVGDSLTILSLGSFTVSTDIPKSTLTAKGSLISATAASTPSEVTVGTNNQTILADSTAASGIKWGASAQSILGTTGDILYASAANTPAALAAGSSGQVLTANGAGVAPSWQAVSANSMTLLSTTNLSGTSTTVSSISGSYTNLIVIISKPYLNSASQLMIYLNGTTSTTYTTGVSNGALFNLSDLRDAYSLQTTTSNAAYAFTIYNYANTSYGKPFSWLGWSGQNATTVSNLAGVFGSASAVTSIQVTTSGGTSTFSGGQILIYGVK